MARIEPENYAFVFALRDEVIDSDHPDFEFWADEADLAALVASGEVLPSQEAPPVGSEKAPTPSAPLLALNLKQAAEALSYASLMIDAGVNAKALSTYMGHATISITMDRYGHLMPGNESEAAKRFDAYLSNGA